MFNIRSVSFFFRVSFQLLFVVLPALLFIAWYTSPESLVLLSGVINMSFVPRSYTADLLHTLSNTDRIFGFCVSAIPMIIELYILGSLIKLFKLYEKGEIFSITNVGYIRKIGYALLVTQIINPFYQALMGLPLTWNNPPGHRFMKITIDQTNLGVIFIALLVILISWIMAEGCRLREELKLTI